MATPKTQPSKEEIALFKELINENRYDFCRLVYLLFPFGVPGTELAEKEPYDWQMEEWEKLSRHLSNPATRHLTYRLAVSSGNGAAKTSFGAMTMLMLLYTQRLRGRITANTKPQLTSVVWPEYEIWCRHARYFDHFFEKFGESIKAKNQQLSEIWRFDTFTWNESTPAAISGLHNKGHAILYTFEEAAGTPAVIYKYASGAFTDTDTIKIWLCFANSDDPESKFEQTMTDPDWHSRRIDTRELSHVSAEQIQSWLREVDGNEDHDDFRVRVRGLPRKSSKDSIISQEIVAAAFDRASTFDLSSVARFPAKIMCDPAWTGGDETTIWFMQGHYARLLERYQLNKAAGEDHMTTYLKICEWERKLHADAVLIDQAEGTSLKTLANANGKWHWELIAFASAPNDFLDAKDSEFANMRALMYYKTRDWIRDGAVLDVRDPEWREETEKQICWTKGTRHKVNGKKLAEPKLEIKQRVGKSPDIADGLVLGMARMLTERLEENQGITDNEDGRPWGPGSGAIVLPSYVPDYDMEDYDDLYN